MDGRVAQTLSDEVTLNTRGLDVRELDMTFMERFLLVLSNPNILFLLVTIGGLALVIELFNFGMVVPGVIGVTCLLLAFVALGNLPVNWAGVGFPGAGAGPSDPGGVSLPALERWALGRLVSFVIGGLLLFHRFGAPSPTMPNVSVNVWLILGTAGVLLGGGLWFLSTMVKFRQKENPESAEAVVGEVGLRDVGPVARRPQSSFPAGYGAPPPMTTR